MSNGRNREERALEVAVGNQLRATRQRLGVTLADLSRSSGVSVGMLSKIENGQTSPSLSTLDSLASAMNVPVGTFFASYDQKREATFVRAGQGLNMERRGSSKGHLYQLLGHSTRTGPQVEPYLITLTESSDAHPVFQHPGVEFIFMIEGEVAYRHGEQSYVLSAGDSLFFDAQALHGPLELRKTPAKFLSVIVSQAEGAGEEKS
ncbi:MAG: XRE family transcriptional regulator [Neomegalonema sp.]|nr:XRE family transcriptional regulator [Neomegalonema sp.]